MLEINKDGWFYAKAQNFPTIFLKIYIQKKTIHFFQFRVVYVRGVVKGFDESIEIKHARQPQKQF